MSADDDRRDRLVRSKTPAIGVGMRAQSPAAATEFEREEITEVGGTIDQRIERRISDVNKNTRAAFAMIRDLREDFKEHAKLDKEALDDIHTELKGQNTVLSDMRVGQATVATELRGLTSAIRREEEHTKLRLVAAAEVQKVQVTEQVESKKFEREHMSRWKIQLLAVVGAITVAVASALLTAYLR